MHFLRIGALVLMALSGCGSDAECAIDTDCPLFNRCEAQACVPLGGVDSGASDAGNPVDAAPIDANRPMPDASARDAGAGDAGIDCVAVAGAYLVMADACAVTAATTVTVLTGAEACQLQFASPGDEVAGMFILGPDGMASATLTIAGTADTPCMVSRVADSLELVCMPSTGECTLVLDKIAL